MENISNTSLLCYGNYCDFTFDITHQLGVKHHSFSVIIPFLLTIILLCFIGLIGNLMTIIVIISNKNMLTTTTNYYLISLAFGDFFVFILTAPIEITTIIQIYPWVFGEFLCNTRYYFIEACTYVTTLNILVFTVERYVAICFPIKAKTIIRRDRALKTVILIWVLSFVIALPAATVYTQKEILPGYAETLVCIARNKSSDERIVKFYIVSAVVLFCVPMSAISVLYTLIAYTLSKTNNLGRKKSVSKTGQDLSRPTRNIGTPRTSSDGTFRTRKQVVKMLGVIALCFALCWLPFHIIRLMPNFSYQKWPREFKEVYAKYLYHVSIVLFYLSSTVNPFLYNLISQRFRRAFKKTICNCFIRKRYLSSRQHSTTTRTTFF